MSREVLTYEDIRLEEECVECYGNGYVLDSGDKVPCPDCKGGLIFTEFGQEILDMVRRHLKVEGDRLK